MFTESLGVELGADEITDVTVQQPTGLTIEQAGQQAQTNTMVIALGSIAVFYLIYRYLIK